MGRHSPPQGYSGLTGSDRHTTGSCSLEYHLVQLPHSLRDDTLDWPSLGVPNLFSSTSYTYLLPHHRTHRARLQTWTCPASSSCLSGLPSWRSSFTMWFTLAGVGAIAPRGTPSGSHPPPTPGLTTGDRDRGTFLVITRALLHLTRKTRRPPRVGVLDSGLALPSARWEAIYSTEVSRSHGRMTGRVRNPVSGPRGGERAWTEGRGLLTWGLSERVLVMEGQVLDEETSRVDVCKNYISVVSWYCGQCRLLVAVVVHTLSKQRCSLSWIKHCGIQCSIVELV